MAAPYHPAAYRKARFVCAIALCTPTGEVHQVEGECPGRIGTEERGTSGFGYDSIFWLPDFQKTMAELDEASKNRISHRAKATEKLIRLVRALAAQGRIPLANP